MTLQELKVSSYLVYKLLGDDKALQSILSSEPNLQNDTDRRKLLKFLNAWGCRQFKGDDHTYASANLLNWFNENGGELPPDNLNLHESSEDEVEKYYALFTSLAAQQATKSRVVNKRFGKVGAAKTLFILRKNFFIPWDRYIIKQLNSDSYLAFLLKSRNEILELEKECNGKNIRVTTLPKLLGKGYASLTRLVDEYNWVTMTRKISPAMITQLCKDETFFDPIGKL